MKRNESVDSWIFVVGFSYTVLLDSLSHWRATDGFQAVAFHEQICVSEIILTGKKETKNTGCITKHAVFACNHPPNIHGKCIKVLGLLGICLKRRIQHRPWT